MTDQEKNRQQLLQELAALRTHLDTLNGRGDRSGASTGHLCEFLDLLLQHAPFPIYATAVDGRRLLVNRAWEELFGLRREQVVGRRAEDVLPPAITRSFEESYHFVVQQGLPISLEETVETPHGRRHYQTVKFPLRDPSGQMQAVGGVSVDITERKQAEERLRESEEQHRLISELTSDYSYTCRIDRDGNIVLDSITEGFQRVVGYTLAEAQERGGWSSFIHPEDLPLTVQKGEGLLAGQRQEAELRVITKAGEVRWVRYSAQPVWDPVQGRAVRLLGAVQDITERRRAEETLRQYAERQEALSRRLLEVQEQERRHLARELHDEVAQVLTRLQLTLERGRRWPAPEQAEWLSEAQTLVKDLAGRVRDLSLRLRPTMLDDLGLLPALLWQVQRSTAQSGIHVTVEHSGLEGRLPPAVETGAYRIVQEALTNVLRHAGAHNGTVRLWREPGLLCLEIADDGHGFDVATVAGRGGAGLSGMRERASLLNGRLEVDSLLGAGTRIYAELPLPKDGPDVGENCQNP